MDSDCLETAIDTVTTVTDGSQTVNADLLLWEMNMMSDAVMEK